MDKFRDLSIASKLVCVCQCAKKERKLSEEIIHLSGGKREKVQDELKKEKHNKETYWSAVILSIDMVNTFDAYDMKLIELFFYKGLKWDEAYAQAQKEGYDIGDSHRKHLIRLLEKVSNEELNKLLED